MALVSLDTMLSTIGLCATDPATRSRYDRLRVMAEAAVKSWCKWELEYTADQVDFYDGNGMPDIPIRRPYVCSIANVWVDQTGAYGNGTNPFASGTVLTQGIDYALVRDGNAPTSGKSGLLRRLTYAVNYWPSDLVYMRLAGGLSYRNPAAWPSGYGNVKVQYSYGFQTIPDDIQLAVVELVSAINSAASRGYMVTSESLGAHNWSLSISKEPELGTVRQLLSRYRDMAV
jgi:hypothetical protein